MKFTEAQIKIKGNKEMTNDLKIKIEIRDGKDYTILNLDSFEMAILDLINEKEWYDYNYKDKFTKIKNKMRKVKGEKGRK